MNISDKTKGGLRKREADWFDQKADSPEKISCPVSNLGIKPKEPAKKTRINPMDFSNTEYCHFVMSLFIRETRMMAKITGRIRKQSVVAGILKIRERIPEK